MSALGFGAAAIGLDVGTRWVRAVQLRWHGGVPEVAAACSVERLCPGVPAAADEVARVLGVLERQGFSGRSVALGLPDHMLVTSTLDRPAKAVSAPVDVIARSELARVHACDPEALEVACWDVPSPQRARETTLSLIAACMHRDVEPLIEVFESSGLPVAAIEPRPLALARACGPLVHRPAAISVVMEIGWTSSQCIVLHHGVVVYHRIEPQNGLDRLRAAISEALSLEPELADHLLRTVALDDGEPASVDAPELTPDERSRVEDVLRLAAEHLGLLGAELDASLTYACHRYTDVPVDGVVLAGPGAALRSAEARLAERLEAKVAVGRPRNVAVCPASLGRAAADPSLLVALGLAGHGLEASL